VIVPAQVLAEQRLEVVRLEALSYCGDIDLHELTP
jgi:hypothetical protein